MKLMEMDRGIPFYKKEDAHLEFIFQFHNSFNSAHQFEGTGDATVLPRIKGLQKPQKLQKFEKFRRRYVKETRNAPMSGCGDCKQAISLSNDVYCGLLREKIDGDACKGCSYFDPEPSEYRLFKRT